MTLQQFAALVKEMRDMQKRWFKGDKSSATLAEAKALERKVDAAVAEMLDDRPSLFGGGI